MEFGYLKQNENFADQEKGICQAIRVVLAPVHDADLYRIIMIDTVMVDRLIWLAPSRLVVGTDRPSNSDPRPLLQFCHPQRGSSAGSQEEEKAQHGYQLEDHRYRSKPGVLPRPVASLPLHLLLGQPSQLEPSVMRQLSVTRTCDHEEGKRAAIGYQIERKEHNQFDDLFQAERLELGLGGWLAQHLDRSRRIGEEYAMGHDEIGQAMVD